MGFFEVSKTVTFAAAHHLRDYHGGCENVHGHNFKVRVTVRGRRVHGGGMLFDFKLLKQAMLSIIDRYDHQDLNGLPDFADIDPSAENIAMRVADHVAEQLRDCAELRLARVDVWETENSLATYYPDDADWPGIPPGIVPLGPIPPAGQ